MDYSRLVKLNQPLLAGTALLGLGSIVTAVVGGPVFSLGANVTASMMANYCGTLVERLRNSSDVLRNEDLAKAAGRTVGKTLLEKVAPGFPEIKSLEALANKTEGYWVEWAEQAKTLNLFESLQEQQLVKIFSTQPDQFAQYQVLTLDEWQEVVTWLFETGCEKRVLIGSVDDYQDVIAALAQELAQNFPKYLRQVLKDDERAFKGMLLDLLGLILSKLGELATREDTQQISQETRQISQQTRRLLLEIQELRQELVTPESSPSPRPDLGAVDTVPKLPDHFLPRPQDMEQLKARLLTPDTQTLVMTGQTRKVGLQGMGGIGKTVLAAALAFDEDVRRQFRDGIVWLTVGINPEPMALYERVARTLGENYAYQEGEAQWNAYLSNLLRDKSCLLVLDDVWQQQEAERFVEVLGSDCRLLLTTRDARLTSGLGANGYQVEMLDDDQAMQLLANWAGLHIEMLPPEAAAVIKHCGRLPLALALSGAQIKMGTCWPDLVAALDAADLRFLDHPHGSIYKSLDVSVAALSAPLRRAYLELGIVAPDVEISETALVRLWGRGGDKQDYQLRRWLTELAQRALVFVSGESPQRWVSLHDVQQKYLQECLQDEAGLHREFLGSYGGGKFPWTGAEVAADVYLYQQAAYHFQKAGEVGQFRQLLLDFAWLQGKLDATDVGDLLSDFEGTCPPNPPTLGGTCPPDPPSLGGTCPPDPSNLGGTCPPNPPNLGGTCPPDPPSLGGTCPPDPPSLGGTCPPDPPTLGGKNSPLKLVESAIRNSAHVLEQDKTQLAGQLWGRLLSFVSPAVLPVPAYRYFWEKIPVVGRYLPKYTLSPLSKGGQGGSKLSQGNQGQFSPLSKGGQGGYPEIEQLLTQAQQGQEKPWFRPLTPTLNPAGGPLLRTLTGHSNWVNAVAIAPDGQFAVSASSDETLKLWDLATGSEVATLTGHSSSVLAVAIAPDGKQAVSASYKTLKLWDLATGKELATLTGHSSFVTAVAIAPDGKQAVSASKDKTLKLWDLATGSEVATLTGHSDPVYAVAIAPDGKQAVSASRDKTLKLWDLATGSEVATLTGHSYFVNAVAIAPDGKQAVSASSDKTLKLWDLATGEVLATLTGHSDSVNAVAIAPDGKQAVSASDDDTLKLWDLATGSEVATLTGHSFWVLAVAIAPDGKQAVSASYDKTLKLWDLATGSEVATLTGHSSVVTAVAIAPDGKQAVSASSDDTLKLWDLATGSEVATLTGHSSVVTAVAIAPNGKQAVSASSDKTLKLWDLATGSEVATLTGHSSGVNAVAIAPDGKQAVSASDDNTLKLWDLATGEVLATFTGEAAMYSCVFAPDGVTVVGGDSVGRVHLLRLEGV